MKYFIFVGSSQHSPVWEKLTEKEFLKLRERPINWSKGDQPTGNWFLKYGYKEPIGTGNFQDPELARLGISIGSSHKLPMIFCFEEGNPLEFARATTTARVRDFIHQRI